MIGDIAPIGSLSWQTFSRVNYVNVVAPQILMNAFIRDVSKNDGEHIILNVSSGAGKHPIDAWATYCGSKAALDLFSKTVQQELKDRSCDSVKIFSVAPGVVDTAMQNQIRNSDESKFLSLGKFKDLKTSGNLTSPKEVANKLQNVLLNPQKYTEVIFDIRDLD